MITLGIETSCDETSVALLDGGRILCSETFSQLIHGNFGGVVPEAASRAHVQKIQPLCASVLEKAGIRLREVDLIAVTDSPGLAGALLVGIGFALGIHAGHGIPITGINHLEGHICSALIAHPSLAFPFLALAVSGGHTSLFQVRDVGVYERLGGTVDDAAGEAFDKVGKLLGFGYPAGRAIEEEAGKATSSERPAASDLAGVGGFLCEELRFPVARVSTPGIDFSFSGLKTAVRYYLEKKTPEFVAENRPHICRAFQKAVVEALVQGAVRARRETGLERLALVGGVASNGRLRQALQERFGAGFYAPPPSLCTDNAAMIARAGYERFLRGMLRSPSMNPSAEL